MAKFLGNALGNDGVAEAIGKQAGDLVEGAVKKAMAGKKGEQGGGEKKKGGGGGTDMGNVLPLAGGSKKNEDGGFDLGDVLQLPGGNKDQGKGGGLEDVVGGLFK